MRAAGEVPEPHVRAVLDAFVKQSAALYAAGRDGTALLIDPDDVTDPLYALIEAERARQRKDTLTVVESMLQSMANAVEGLQDDAHAALSEAVTWVARMRTTPDQSEAA